MMNDLRHAALAALLVAAPVLAQQPPEPVPVAPVETPAPQPPSAQAPIDATDEQVFRSGSNLVVLHVNVFDGRSDAIPDLPQSAFLVFDEGRAQEITFFRSEDVPVAAGLVIDNSSSLITKRNLVVTGAMAFAESSHPEDELFTIHFTENVRLGLPQVAFTSSRPLLRSVLAGLSPGGRTALHDAVIAGLDHLERASHQKRVLIVLSDGEDNASRHSEEEMLARAVRSDAIVYTVSLEDGRTGAAANPGLLRKLARLTGGASYFPRDDRSVVERFVEIASNIRRGYSIGYVPSDPGREGQFRNVKVIARAPGRGRLNVQHRDGYITTGSSGSR